jgi:hypothetical protein
MTFIPELFQGDHGFSSPRLASAKYQMAAGVLASSDVALESVEIDAPIHGGGAGVS